MNHWSLSFRIGTVHDLRAMHQHHYLQADPFPPQRVLVAVESGNDIGALAVSPAPINGSWRREIPGWHERISHTEWLNTNLRTISRVVVKPQYRGLGVASALVRHYLSAPLTPYTEAIASMGYVSPFFERAGMVRIGTVHSARDLRLARILNELALTPLAMLRLAALQEPPAPLVQALHRWANDSRSTRSRRTQPGAVHDLAFLAARRLVAPPCVYLAPATSSVKQRSAA
jgi:GNAT superfamily N-acetyltransferase